MTNTNIKNLPDNQNYFTEIGWSQSYPWAELKRTAKSVTLVKVNVSADPEWKPNILPGGFAGHCTNQSEQTWLYKDMGPSTKVIRMTKKGWASQGVRFIEGCASEFYDYNF